MLFVIATFRILRTPQLIEESTRGECIEKSMREESKLPITASSAKILLYTVNYTVVVPVVNEQKQ